jgi:spermidine synthase
VKAHLGDLSETGKVVGRLSAVGTAGAIVGTFVTGFVLVANLATTAIVLAVGSLTVVAGLVLWWSTNRNDGSLVTVAVAVALLAGAGILALDDGCDVETAYFCARIEVDPDDPGGRVLWLDTIRHSHVNLDDPASLSFRSTRLLAAAVEAQTDGAIDVVHVGGGGMTMPRWIEATRPGSTNRILELDPGLVDLARSELGFDPGAETSVDTGDARIGIRSLRSDSADVVIGDAFGGVAVPWHLTTTEFLSQVSDVLRPGGMYAMNLIDGGSMAFARAEMATLRQVFDHVAAVAPVGGLEGGGNVILVASDEPVDVDRIIDEGAVMDLEVEGIEGSSVVSYIGDAPALTDEFAPVDQLLGTPGTPPPVDPVT